MKYTITYNTSTGSTQIDITARDIADASRQAIHIMHDHPISKVLQLESIWAIREMQTA